MPAVGAASALPPIALSVSFSSFIAVSLSDKWHSTTFLLFSFSNFMRQYSDQEVLGTSRGEQLMSDAGKFKLGLQTWKRFLLPRFFLC